MSFITSAVTISLLIYHALAEGDSIMYDLQVQSQCTEVTRGPTSDCRWKEGLDLMIDQVALEGKIVAYKIQWFNGNWSGWFVPGYNDIDWKVNLNDESCPPLTIKKNSLRRVWSYFYDHNHMFIVCKPTRSN